MDFDIAVVAIRLARQHGFQPHLLGMLVQRQQGFFRIRHHGGVILRLGHFDQLGGVGQFVGQLGDGAE